MGCLKQVYLNAASIFAYAKQTVKKRLPGHWCLTPLNIISRDFNPGERNRVWCTDFTNLEYGGSTMRFSCTIIDLYNYSVVASMSLSFLNSELAINTLKRALATYKIPKGRYFIRIRAVGSHQKISLNSVGSITFSRA